MPLLPASGYNIPTAPSIEAFPAAPEVKQDIRATPDMFGGLTGEAVSRFGQSLEKAAGAFENTYKFYRETAAADQSLKTQVEVNKLMYGDPNVPGDRGFIGLEGEHAMREMPVRRKQIEAIISGARANLGDQYAVSHFDNEIQRFRNYILTDMGRKYDQEMTRWRDQTDKGLKTLSGADASRAANSGDMARFKESLANDEALVRKQGADKGLPQADIDAEVVTRRSLLAKEKAEALLATDPLQAREFINLNGDILLTHHPELSARANAAVVKQLQDDIIAGKDVSRYSEKLPGPMVRGGAIQGAISPMGKEHYNYQRSIGASPNEAAVLTAAAEVESSFNPEATHDHAYLAKKGLPPGYGMYGHNDKRLAEMQKQFGPRPTWQQQAQFALQELRSRPEGARVNAATTAEQLRDIQQEFEVGVKTPESDAKRLAATQKYIGLSGGSTAPAQPVPTAGADRPPAPPAAASPWVPITGPDNKTYMLTGPQAEEYKAIKKPEDQQKFLVEAVKKPVPPSAPGTPAPAATPGATSGGPTTSPGVNVGSPRLQELMRGAPERDSGQPADTEVPGLVAALERDAQRMPANLPPQVASSVWQGIVQKERRIFNAAYTDQQHALQARKRDDEENDHQVMQEYRLRLGTNNPPTVAEVTADKRWRSEKNAQEMIGFIGRALKPDPPAHVAKAVTSDLYRRMDDKEADRLTSMDPVNQAFINGQIAEKDLTFLEKRWEAKTGTKEAYVKNKTDRIWKSMVQRQLRPHAAMGPTMEQFMDIQAQDQGQMTSGEREMGWREKVEETINDYKKEGKNTDELFDPKPGNSKYIGSPEFMAEFMPEQALPTVGKGGSGPDVSTLDAVKRTFKLETVVDQERARAAVVQAFESGKYGPRTSPEAIAKARAILEGLGLSVPKPQFAPQGVPAR